MTDTYEGEIKIRIDGRDAIMDARDLENALNNVEGASNKATSGLGMVKAALAALAAIGVTTALKNIASTLIDVTRETQGYTAMLKTATGSTDAAGAAFDRLNAFARTTPYTLEQSVKGFVTLTNLGLEPSEKAMTSYGNTAAAMGKSMNQMIEAVADASTNEFERLKEFGIKSKKEGDNISFTFRGITTTVKNSSEEIQQYLINIGETQFSTAMADKVNTIDGQLSNLEQSFDDLWRVMADGLGVGEIVTKALKMASDAVGTLTKALEDFFETYKVQKLADLYTRQKQLIEDVITKQKELDSGFKGSVWGLRQIAEFDLSMTQGELGGVTAEIVELNEHFKTLNTTTDTNTKAVKDNTEGLGDNSAALHEQLLAAMDLELAFVEEEHLLGLTARQQVIYNTNKQLGNLLTVQQKQYVIDAALSLYDEKAALEATAKAEKARVEGMTAAAKPMEVTWNKTIQRLDDGFAKLWKDALRGEITALDFMKEAALDWLAEMIHIFTTKKIVANFQMASSGMVGAAGAAETAGINGEGESSMGVSNVMSSISSMGQASGYGLYNATASGINYLGNATSYGNIMAPTSGGFAMSNMGLGLSGIAGGFIGGMVSDGPYAGIGGSLGGVGGSMLATTIATGSGMASGAMLGSVVPVIGTIVGAVIGGLLAGSFGGNSDETPDMTVWTGKNTSSRTLWQAENDISFQASGRYGNVGVMTQHDAFESDADAEDFAESVKQRIAVLDEAIFVSVDSGVNAAINSAMGKNWENEIKYEEGGDVEVILEQRFDRIFSSMNTQMEGFYESLRDGGIDYAKATVAASALSLAVKDTDISMTTARAVFAEMDETVEDLVENIEVFGASLNAIATYAEEDLVDSFAEFTEQQEIANESLYQSYNRNLGKAEELIQDFDWTVDSLAEIATLVEANRTMEIALLQQISSLSEGVNGYIEGIIEAEEYSFLDAPGKQDFDRGKAADAFVNLSTAEDPALISKYATEAAQYVMSYYSNTPDAQKETTFKEEVKPALEIISQTADDQFELAKNGILDTAKEISAAIEAAFSTITIDFKKAASDQRKAASDMKDAATDMITAANTPKQVIVGLENNPLSELMY